MRLIIEAAIAKCEETGKLHLANMMINDDEIQEILEKIKPFLSKVNVINLDANQLSDKGASILGDKLQDFYSLKELSVQFNQIERVGAIAIFGLKNGLPNLDILFRGNKISNVAEIAEIERVAQDRSRPKLRY